MSLSKSFNRSRARCVHIGNRLLDGPEYIVPPVKIDDFAWYDSVLKIVRRPPGIGKNAYSFSIFVDNTVNRAQNFLAPLIRYAEWDRNYEWQVKRVRKWPKFKIVHHILSENEQEKVDYLLTELDKTFSTITFLTAGLITDRSDPDGCYVEEETQKGARALKIERWNFCQRLELMLGNYTGVNRHIERAAESIERYIEELCKNDNYKNYRENYKVNLKDMKIGRRGWFYRPPLK